LEIRNFHFELCTLNFELINHYFPDLTARQADQFTRLGELYPEWNAKINIISRKDIENLFERHILHSMGIAKVIDFNPGTKILDAGTGGGFPGIPLAILFPEVSFHLVDSTAKKLSVVEAIAEATGLQNISTEHCRFEDHRKKYDFVVSRAVASLETMVMQLWKNINAGGFNPLPNGILYLKGGDLEEEIKGMGAWGHGGMGNQIYNLRFTIYKLADYFEESFFETKAVVHLF
jgi:16S rRNA (guanine527-N7)-methyltransferase